MCFQWTYELKFLDLFVYWYKNLIDSYYFFLNKLNFFQIIKFCQNYTKFCLEHTKFCSKHIKFCLEHASFYLDETTKATFEIEQCFGNINGKNHQHKKIFIGILLTLLLLSSGIIFPTERVPCKIRPLKLSKHLLVPITWFNKIFLIFCFP